MNAWTSVEKARDENRPKSIEYIERIFDDFIELHGDRTFKDDASIIGGIGRLKGQPVTVIAQEKGKGTEEKIKRNFGMTSPEGYRKSLRLMKQAQKFGRPIVCFVDTPGAYPGIGAEERGQGEAIARNLFEMSSLRVPIISIIIGEGGSGGALALALADRVWMLEKSIYSILSPEGFASILYKDNKRAKEAAEIMKLTAKDLLEFEVIEEVMKEPEIKGALDIEEVTKNLKNKLAFEIEKLKQIEIETLLEKRYMKYRGY